MELTNEHKKNIKTLFDLFYSDNIISNELKQKYKKEFEKTYILFNNNIYTDYKILGG